MKFKLLSSATLTLALVASTGCTKKATSSDCDAVGKRVIELRDKRANTPEEAEALKSIPGMAELVKSLGDKQADVFKTRCTADGWLKESSDCVIKAATFEAAMECKVTDEQTKKLGADINALVAEQAKEQDALVAKATADAAAAAAAAADSAAAGSAVDAAGSAAGSDEADGSADDGTAD